MNIDSMSVVSRIVYLWINLVQEPLEIELPDVEPAAFLTLLKFLYTDEVNIGPESVMTTLYTGARMNYPTERTYPLYHC